MNVLLISPGFPGEMPFFTRALAAQGARVIGLGDQHESALPEMARRALTAYVHVPNLQDEAGIVARVVSQSAASGARIDRVECLWEPCMYLAARLREALGAPGLSVEQTIPFRDKERMKQVIDAAGLRTPWHRRARSAAEVRAAAQEVGFPLVLKPIAGAGSTDTHRIESWEQLEQVLPTVRHVEQVSIEEYIDGDELTYDTICAGGRILFENVSFYRPRPIEEKKYEWICPSSTCLRDLDVPELADGLRLGRAALGALGFHTGFSHMEWYRKADGEVVFGEIGARPPGARLVDAMNVACDADLFVAWAEAVVRGRLSRPIERHYNATVLSKRANGQGRIRHIEGLERLRHELGPSLAVVDLLPIGAERRNWKQSAVSDGFVIVRHRDLETTFKLADRVARDLQLYAG